MNYLLQRLAKSITHIPIPNKLTKQFPENNSSIKKPIRFLQTYCYCDETKVNSHLPK